MRTRLVLAVAAVLLAGCAPGEDASSSTTTTPRPDLAVAAWDGLPVETICLAGTEVHDDVARTHTPVMDAVAGAIDAEDDDGVAARLGSSSCDVTITFDIRGRPLPAFYSGGATGTLYTGALVDGTITLSAEGRDPMMVGLTNRIDPPESFSLPEWKEPPGDPEDAPLWRTVSDGVCGALAGWFEGPDLTPLLMEIRGSWPPRGEECGGYGERPAW